MESSTTVRAHRRRDGSFVRSYFRRIVSKFSRNEVPVEVATVLREGTTQLAEPASPPAPTVDPRIHKNQVVAEHFFDKDLTKHSWSDSSIAESKFDNCDLSGCDFERTLMGAQFRMCKLNDAILKDADLTATMFVDSEMKNIDFTSTKSFDDAVFYGCNLTGANLSGLKFQLGQKMMNCNLQNANLSGVDLSQADLCGSDLRGVNWVGSKTKGMIVSDLDKTMRMNPKLGVIHGIAGDVGGQTRIPLYTQHNFAEACEMMNLSEKQFEFLVLSGTVEVRDHHGVVVKSNFDPDKHHVPAWSVQNFSL